MSANNVQQVKYRQVLGQYGGKPLHQLGEKITYITSAAIDYNSVVAKLNAAGITAIPGAVLDIIHVGPAGAPVVYGNPADVSIWRCTWYRQVGGKPVPGSERSADLFAAQQGGGSTLTGGGRPDPSALLTVIDAEFPATGTIVITRASQAATGAASN